jgi:hypothetical protein
MLTGVVQTGGHEWQVREEKRQGPRSQIFLLTAVDAPQCEMHIRPMPGREAMSIEEVQRLAADPSSRWFLDGLGERWQARLVIHTEAGGPEVSLAKFISARGEVYEGAYPFPDGLGVRTDAELRELLTVVRTG